MFFSWAWPDGTATFVPGKWGGWKKGVQHFLPWCVRAPPFPSTHFPDLPGLPASSSDTPHFKEFSPAACIKGVHQSNRKFFTTSQIVPPGYMIPTRTGVPFPIALLSSISSENQKKEISGDILPYFAQKINDDSGFTTEYYRCCSQGLRPNL